MTIEYSNSESTHTQRALMVARARGTLCLPGHYYWQSTFPIIVAGLGAFSAFSCGGSPLFLLIGIMLTGYAVELIYRWRPYDHWLHNRYFSNSLEGEQKSIRLKIADDGLHEHQGDILSFAAWKDVSDTILEGDLLVIKLSSGQEALIPRKSFGVSELNLEDIRNEIDRRRNPNERSV